MPVSYTHLDVYKRQRLKLIVVERSMITIVIHMGAKNITTVFKRVWILLKGESNTSTVGRGSEGVAARQGVFPSCSMVAIDCLVIFVEHHELSFDFVSV